MQQTTTTVNKKYNSINNNYKNNMNNNYKNNMNNNYKITTDKMI